MAFRSRRLDKLYSEDDEVGLIYTRDKYGQLQAPPGYDFSKKEKKKNYLSDYEPKAASCSILNQNGRMSPTSLFSICLDFVAKNITMVESLRGFPDIVGKELFDRVHINQGFPRGSHQTLQLFCDAYGSLVLNKLSLKNQYLEVNEIDYLQCFQYLTELDLSHCLLGIDHELLVHVAKVTSLVKLSLKDNCLEDSDLKHFTLPQRVMGVGPHNLSILDLSCNPKITDLSVQYLTIFSQLTALNLSGTSVTLEGGVARLMKDTNLALSPTSTDFHSKNKTKTEGWASPVIEEWLSSNSKKHLKLRNHDTRNKKTNSFYVKRTKKKIIEDKKVIKVREEPETNIVLTLRKTTNGNLDENSIEKMNEYGSHGKRLSENSNMIKVDSPIVKRKLLSTNQDSEGFDEDIMELYLKSYVKVDNKKRKLCLADLAF